MRPSAPLPAPEGIERRDWVAANLSSMRALLDPVLERAGAGMGPLKPAMQIGMGFALSAEVGLVVGYLAHMCSVSTSSCCSTRRVDDTPPRLLFVLPNLGAAVRAFERRRAASS